MQILLLSVLYVCMYVLFRNRFEYLLNNLIINNCFYDMRQMCWVRKSAAISLNILITIIILLIVPNRKQN